MLLCVLLLYDPLSTRMSTSCSSTSKPLFLLESVSVYSLATYNVQGCTYFYSTTIILATTTDVHLYITIHT